MADPSTLWEVLNSEFVKSLVGALAGAFAGAYAAQRIAERSKVREELLKEVRNANAATTITFGITDALIAIKKQQVKPLFDAFNAGKEAVQKFQKSRTPGDPRTFEFKVDLQTFQMPKLSIEQLRQIAFERISAPTRAVMLIGVLDRTLDGLDGFIAMRNALIEEFKASSPLHPAVYYGLETSTGADQRYASALTAISTYTDDCIYFSKLLGDDLTTYGRGLKAKLPKQLRASAPTIVSADFSKAQDVLPLAANYQDWETMVRTTPALKPWWKFWA